MNLRHSVVNNHWVETHNLFYDRQQNIKQHTKTTENHVKFIWIQYSGVFKDELV